MTLEITDHEQNFLLELLERDQRQMLQELDHTDSREYRALVTGRLRLVEELLRKLRATGN